MSCSHEDCQCQIEGCGIDHPKNWKPTMKISINLVTCGGDDAADCMAHYLLQCGYPNDRPVQLRGMALKMAARRGYDV